MAEGLEREEESVNTQKEIGIFLFILNLPISIGLGD